MTGETPDQARKRLGRAGEDAAHRFLTGAGLEIVARGFRSRFGEIDLVAHDGLTVVFVEVKARTADRFGRPAEAVTWTKRSRLIRTAAVWLARTRGGERPCRFDVIEVEPRGHGFRITHHRDAFRPGD